MRPEIIDLNTAGEERIVRAKTDARFQFVDGLRGIAALLVVIDHAFFNSNAPILGPLAAIFPNPLPSFVIHGTLGVQIFFVLSGFVIAHSVRSVNVTASAVGRFVVRRQIRLDPPYWAAMLLVLLLHRIELALPFLNTSPLPRFGEVALNASYLYGFWNLDGIVGVAWTLCIEIQFYLAFILITWLTARLGTRTKPLRVGSWIVLLSGLMSLGYVSIFTAGDSQGPWFVGYWFYFASGVLGYWASTNLVPRWLFWVMVGAMGVSCILCFRTEAVEHLGVSTMTRIVTSRQFAGLSTALLLFTATHTGNQCRWLTGRAFQYFGRISYSLYLTHMVVFSALARILYKVIGPSLHGSILCLTAGVIGSIVFAHGFYRLIEKPSARLAKRLPKEAPCRENSLQTELAAEG